MTRIAAGDPEALGDLYDRYGRVVFGVLYRMLGDAQASEEVMQDAFHAVWRQARTYRPDRGAVRTWLMAIARNAAIDRRRMKRRPREVTIDESAISLGDEASVEMDVAAALRAERVRAVVAALPPEQRRVLHLAFWGGLSQTEIAARAGMPLGTVKSRLRLAMAKLRDELADESGS